ncbi:MAG: response regulator [Defluviitaleaceae bacterium]|nr:response regulator [Defluviitaleaceae bacterium]
MWVFALAAAALLFALAAVVYTYHKKVSALSTENGVIRAMEERNKLIVDVAPIACFLVGKDFKAIDCNRAALGFFGLADVQEGIDRFAEIFTAHKGEEMKWYFDEAMQNGYTRFEWGLVNRYARLAHVEITFVRCGFLSEDIIAAYINDVSAVTDVLSEKENSEAKSRFLARMSHEIRTPISAVLGIAEIQLQSGGLSAEQELAFNNIYASGNTLLSIVNDILDLSKIEAGRMELNNGPYEVAGLVSDVTQLNRVYREEKEIEFNVRVDENIPAVLVGDELRIKQILNNFISNAFKYTVKGTVSFSMYALASEYNEPDAINLLITIRDTGRGMTKEQKDALFEEYTRFHEKEAQIVKGTGLGMSIAFNLLQMMNAVFEVESEPDRGTTISLLIPQGAVGKELLGKKAAQNLRKLNDDVRMTDTRLQFIPEPLPHGKVLVVDDVPTNIFVAKGLLNLYGLMIDACTSGKECIARVKDNREYDIIFMDHHMPGLSGMETTAQLREMGYTKPIVALTANALVGQAEEFINSGFDAFLSKPISTVRLNEILDKFIRNKGTEKDTQAQPDFEPFEDESPGDELNEFYTSPEIQTEIRADFIESHRDTLPKLKAALERNDMKEALYIAHTLKGIAVLLSEKALTKAAYEIESTVKKGATPKSDALPNLEKHFNEAYERIAADVG